MKTKLAIAIISITVYLFSDRIQNYFIATTKSMGSSG